MELTIPYLRSQSDLAAELDINIRDTAQTRWPAASRERYTALNQVLMTWADHVKLPHVYTISGGWVAGTYEYALPAYMRPPYFPELKRTSPYDDYGLLTASSHWQEVPGWTVVSDGAGGQNIRLYSPPRSVEGQVGFYSPGSRVPTTTTLPVTSGSTSSTATTMLISTAIDVDDVGYVKVDSEWMVYYGVTRGTSTTTLNNLIRGVYGTTAAIHTTGTTVYWGVAVDTPALWGLLFDMWRMRLHEYFLQDGGTHEYDRHSKAVGYYGQLAANFWPTYKPARQTTGISLNQKAYALRR